ncbi:hypothetical protein TNCV_2361561 [Trichonephila clavipes]|nr:hypothetical protein TNCV_2361561 [Trichonephila clavipes]
MKRHGQQRNGECYGPPAKSGFGPQAGGNGYVLGVSQALGSLEYWTPSLHAMQGCTSHQWAWVSRKARYNMESFVRPSTIPNPRDPEENPLIRRIGRAGKVFLRPFPLTLKSRLFRWLSVAEDLEDGMSKGMVCLIALELRYVLFGYRSESGLAFSSLATWEKFKLTCPA